MISNLLIDTRASLKTKNTFGVKATAEELASFDSVESLSALLRIIKFPPLIIGGGSNVLFTQNQEKAVLLNRIKGLEVVNEDENHVFVRAGAGTNWHNFVLWTLEKDYGGIENLSLIPGNIGAAPIQNIGAYGVELESVFDHLEAFELETGEIHQFNSSDCQFGYRQSIFKTELKGKLCITHVTLKLAKKHTLNLQYGAIKEIIDKKGITNPTIRDVSNAVVEIRNQKLPDPAKLGNAGSFFKNPELSKESFDRLRALHPDVVFYALENGTYKIPAGWLIEQSGWKGERIGDAGCHKDQALVLVNHGEATGNDILDLARIIQRDVQTQFGIILSAEVNIL